MDFNIEVRRKQLQSLDQYISSSKDKVQSILDCLGWSAEKVNNVEEQVTCSFNKGHRIHPKRAVEHVKSCQIKKERYDLKEQFLSEPLNHPVQSITIDPFIKIQVLNKVRSENPGFRAAWNGADPDPRTSDRLFSTFSSDERLALYDFCVQHTKGPPIPPDMHMAPTDTTGDSKTLSEGELKALERDAKRRQVKYKSVHTNRKTYTEVMKQVIENQMALYEEWIKKSHEITARSDDTKPFCEDNFQSNSTKKDKSNGMEAKQNYRDQDSVSSEKHENNETVQNIESKQYLDLEKSYDKYKRCRSPSEYSNSSSNKSRRRENEDKYSHTSRHSSLDSLRTSHRHSEGKYKTRDRYEEKDREYRKHSGQRFKNFSNDEKDNDRHKRTEVRSEEKKYDKQERKHEKHGKEDKYRERNGKIESDRNRLKERRYQDSHEREDRKYRSDSRSREERSNKQLKQGGKEQKDRSTFKSRY